MCSKCHWTILSQGSCVCGERRGIACAEGSFRHSVLSNSKRRTTINTKSLHRHAPECKGCPGTFWKGCHETEHKTPRTLPPGPIRFERTPASSRVAKSRLIYSPSERLAREEFPLDSPGHRTTLRMKPTLWM